MPFSFGRLGLAVVAGSLVLAGGEAWAQAKRPAAPQPQAQAQAQPAAPAQAPAQVPGQPPAPQQPPGPQRVDLVGMQADWTKVCGHDQVANKDICYTTRDFGTAADQQPALALAVYDVKGDDQRILRLLMPVALLLKPGFRFAIDKGAAQEGEFEICFPNGCFAEAKIKGPTVDQLKKGTSLNVAVKNQVNAEVTFVLPLAGFGKAFDGPAIDPQVLAAQQKELEDQLQKRADAARQQLESSDSAGAAAPAPAGAATPAGSAAGPMPMAAPAGPTTRIPVPASPAGH